MGWFSSSEEKPASEVTHDISAPSGFSNSYSTPSTYDSGSSFAPSLSSGSTGSGTEDLQKFVQQQEVQAKLQEGVFKMNAVCWEKCMTSIDSRLSGKQETCVVNCVERFIDSTMFITQRFSQLLQAQSRQ